MTQENQDTLVARPTYRNISPALFQQYVQQLITNIARQVPAFEEIVILSGRWQNNGRSMGGTFYEAAVADDGGVSVKVAIAESLVNGRGITPGMNVDVVGLIDARLSKFGKLDIRLDASDIRPAIGQMAANTEARERGSATLEALRAVNVVRVPFPERDNLSIVLIRSRSAGSQVDLDCRGELDKLGNAIDVREACVNILDPVAIAQEIRDANDADVLMLIRGGGNANDFMVFEDMRVVEAMAACRAHRVVGLGHSGNNTVLDLVADYTSRTPAQAGAYVRERIEERQRILGDLGRELRLAREQRDTLREQASALQSMLNKTKGGIPIWVAAVAFVAGAILVLAIR